MNNKIRSLELSIIYFLLINSSFSTIIINLFKGYNIPEIIISLIISFIIGYIYINFINKRYKKDILELLPKEKIIRLITILLLIICTTLILIYSTYNLSSIIKDIVLPNHNINLIIITIILLSYYLSTKEINVTIKTANLLFFFYIVISLTIIIFSINNISTFNLLPLNNIIKKNNILSLIVTINAPLLLLQIISKHDIEDFYNFKRNIRITYIISYIFITMRLLLIISILGINYIKILKYPEISLFKNIDILNIFKRMEEILIINNYIENFTLISICSLYIKRLIEKINTNKKYNFIYHIIILLIIININSLNNKYLIISNILFIIINTIIIKKERIN